MKKQNQGITYKELEDVLTNILGKIEEQDNKYLKQKKGNKNEQ
tara:strand:- start:755 stop:883 length:129 start_codon:yes stop_codon:yes gene_type:complete